MSYQHVSTEENLKWTQRAGGNHLGIRFFIWIISRTGLLPAYFFLIFASFQYVLLDRKTKKHLREYRSALGLRTTLVSYFCHFYSFGMSLIDRYAHLLSSRPLFRYDSINEELINEQLARGKGVILLGAHVGNWEIAGNVLQQRMNVPINLLMYDAESERVKQVVSSAVERRNVNVIFVSQDSPDSIIEVVNALKRGEIICMHGDRVLGTQRSEIVSFLGKQARFPSGPFSIAAMTGAAVIPFFSVKTGWRHYTFSAFEPVIIDNSDREIRQRKICDAVKHFSISLETIARRYPHQWYNLYNFWVD